MSADVVVDPRASRPWPALWSFVLGFFMILVDSTIVQVATPALMAELGADVTSVVWVTSAYLLAYATPLLVTGRLGDRFGPKPGYLVGLVLFTLASLACGLAGSIELLVAARVLQGLGAALMTPQSMALITRTFPPDGRGAAMGLWGGIAGVALLVGPILGGILVDGPGWAWIFFVNVPVGVVVLLLVVRYVPRLPLHSRAFDWPSVVLSSGGMLALVLGVQEGERTGWSTWWLIALGALLLVAFVLRQRRAPEPLMPLRLFRDRNFTLGCLAIAAAGVGITAMGIPVYLYTQTARGLSPTESALLTLPMAALAGVLAPFVGRWLQGRDLRLWSVLGIGLTAASLGGYALCMRPDVDVLWLLVPSGLMGLASAFLWGPLAMTATRGLPMDAAGAGSGVYNAMRQVGAVTGSAAIAALVTARLAAELGAPPTAELEASLPAGLVAPFSAAMAQSMLLPIAALVLAGFAALGFRSPAPTAARPTRTAPAEPRP